MIRPDVCSDLVRAYDAQGIHRTGTEVDTSSADWMVSELRSRGVTATTESFAFERVDPEPCVVSGPGWTIDGYPLVDSRLPSPGTSIHGRLGSEPRQGQVASVDADGHGQASSIDALRTEPWEAIIAAMEGPAGGLTVRNAWNFESPSGPPVVQVPADEWRRRIAADAAATLTIICGARRSKVTAHNVIGSVPGSNPELAPIVVLTPRSGWWHCAGERGGGLAVWLEVAREVQAARLNRTIAFVATTGHELGFSGIKRHLERHPDEAAAAECWIHLGANIGASGTTTVVRAMNQALLDRVTAAERSLAPAPGETTYELRPEPPGGEAQVVVAHGGSYISMVGAGFSLFHSSTDRWPGAIDAHAIARNAQLVLELLRQFEPQSAER